MRAISLSIFLLGSSCLGAACAQDGGRGDMAHVFGYRPAPGVRPAFEAGYRQHLQWHAAHRDPLPWHGWYIVDGPRAGIFVDGSFEIGWDALDRRPAPADDAADAARTFLPHAVPVLRESWRRVAAGRTPALRPPAPQLRVLSYHLRAGQGARFDRLLEQVLAAEASTRGEAWYAPTTGAPLQRRMQLTAWRDGNDERQPADLESRIARHADAQARGRWLREYADCVHAVEAETWHYEPTLSRLPAEG